jgi:hypothetical protein
MSITDLVVRLIWELFQLPDILQFFLWLVSPGNCVVVYVWTEGGILQHCWFVLATPVVYAIRIGMIVDSSKLRRRYEQPPMLQEYLAGKCNGEDCVSLLTTPLILLREPSAGAYTVESRWTLGLDRPTKRGRGAQESLR